MIKASMLLHDFAPSTSRVFALLSFVFLTAPLQAQTQSPIFPVTTTSDLVSGSGTNLTSADFNGDGLTDLAYVDDSFSQQRALIVEINQGNGHPAIPITTALSTCFPAGVGVPMPTPDINHDGKLDLVFGCPGFVAVMLGNGDGSFQAATTYPILGYPAVIATTDLNGDGYLDVVAETQAGVSVFLNGGTSNPGTLSNGVSYTMATGFGLVTGDFNGDGKQDVVTGQSVLYGNGDGTLQSAQTIQIPAFGGGTWVAADFNADGLTDLAYVDVSEHISPRALHVLLGSPNGAFVATTPVPFLPSFESGLLPPFVINNGGGKSLDLAYMYANLTIFNNDGQGNFALGAAYAMTGFQAVTPQDSNGRSDLLINWGSALFTLTNNGDGTFAGAPPSLGVGPLSGAAGLALASIVDLNNDGLSDLLWIDERGELGTSLSFGNGAFSPLMETGTGPYGMVASGDFNGDGNADAVAITYGSAILDATPAEDSKLFFYAGTGNGGFQAAGCGVDLQTTGAMNEVAGDFNGDGRLDVVFVEEQASGQTASPYLGGLVLLPGNGDGTFSAPVAVTPQAYFSNAVLYVSDLNNDGKPDLIWNGSVYLNSGNGTFTATGANSLLNSALAFGDLNGDGIPDLVAAGNLAANVYAGNGDGTFQSTPFYIALNGTFMGMANGFIPAAWIGDVNGDGHNDLLIACLCNPTMADTAPGGVINISLSDGKGGLVEDLTPYYAGSLDHNPAIAVLAGGLARVNNQAPAPAGDSKLDLVIYSNYGFTSLLNQLNPAPAGPTPLPSKTALASSATNATVGQQVAFTATVTGVSPTGTVIFASGSTALGTGMLSNGAGTLKYAFTAAGSYPVVANYSGDGVNAASSSSAVTITVVAPDFAISASPDGVSLREGGSPVSTTLTITPSGGYAGTVKFTCDGFPKEVYGNCVFSPATVSAAGGVVKTTLTITTTAPTSFLRKQLSGVASGIALAGIFGLLLFPKRTRIYRHRLAMCAILILCAAAMSLLGCGGGGGSSPTYPYVGNTFLNVTASDSSGSPSHQVQIGLSF